MTVSATAAQRRVERAEALAPLGVRRDPVRLGLDLAADPHARGDGRRRVGPRAARDAAEQRGAVGRALLDHRALERQLEHRGDDPQPQLRARAAARDAAALRRRRRARAAGRASRAARRRRPRAPRGSSAPRSWRSDRPVNEPRASGSACGVRSPARYGRNVSPSAPGSQRRRLVDELARSRCPAPRRRAASAASRRRTASRPSRASRRAPRGRTRARARARRPRTPAARRTRRRSCRARSRAAPAGRRRRRARPPPGRPAPAATGTPSARLAGDLGRLEQPRQPGRVELERVEHLVAPAPPRDVEQQRAGRVGHVDRVLAAEPQPHVVLRQHDRARSARSARARAGAATAASGAVKPVSARLPVQRDQLARGRPAPRSRRTRPRCGRRSRGSPGGSRGRASSSATSPCIWPLSPMPATSSTASAASACSVARHQSSGSCSAQPGRGVESG